MDYAARQTWAAQLRQSSLPTRVPPGTLNILDRCVRLADCPPHPLPAKSSIHQDCPKTPQTERNARPRSQTCISCARVFERPSMESVSQNRAIIFGNRSNRYQREVAGDRMSSFEAPSAASLFNIVKDVLFRSTISKPSRWYSLFAGLSTDTLSDTAGCCLLASSIR
jgi:hypothetical protein